MTTVTVEEIERDPTGWIRRMEAGESMLVTRDDLPLAEITPVKSQSSKLRPMGLCAGEFVVPDDFDDPLPEEVVREFEGR